ncbi:secreted protein [Melampsora americana]|nr:secreted protein [Melampsora americana]
MRSVFSAFVIASVCLYNLQDVAAQGQTTGQNQTNGFNPNGQGQTYQNNGQNLGQGSQYQQQSANPNSAVGQPTMVPLQCTQGYMPITEEELIAMSNDPQNGADPSGAGTSSGIGSNSGYGSGTSPGNSGVNGQQLRARSLSNPSSSYGNSLGSNGYGSSQTGNQNPQYTSTQNPNTQYGGNQYGNTQYGGNQYGNTQYGGNQYGNTQYGNNPSGNTQYGDNQYGNNPSGNTQYGNNQYGNNQYGNNQNTDPQSQIAPQAICAGNDDKSSGLCDTSTCTGSATCKMCQQLIINDANSPAQTDQNVIQQVNCVGNYFKAGPNDQDQSSMCTDVNQNMYTCKGGCVGQMTCQSCISREDPALQDDTSGQSTGTQNVQYGSVQNGGVQNGGVQNGGVQNGGVQNGGVQNGGVQNAGVQNSSLATSQNGANQTDNGINPQTGLPALN